MPLIENARLRVKAVVPPGRSIVGCYPLSLFRLDRFHLPSAPGLSLCCGGRLVPCDGQVHRNEASTRTLCIGNFFAFDVQNETGELRPFDLTVSGPTIDGPEEHEAWAVLGTFAMEVEQKMLPPREDDGDYGDYSGADGKGLR